MITKTSLSSRTKDELVMMGKQFHSKQKSKRIHLQGLLSKMARLKQEFLILKKSLKEGQKHYESVIKQNLGMKNETEFLLQEDFQQEVELYSILKALDAEASLIAELISSYSETGPDDRFAKYGIRIISGEKLDLRDYKEPRVSGFLL